jgi:hypothetical protein
VINETKFILAQCNEELSEHDMIDELIGWAFDSENDAKEKANFGARLAPQSKIFKITVYIEEVK